MTKDQAIEKLVQALESLIALHDGDRCEYDPCPYWDAEVLVAEIGKQQKTGFDAS